MGDGTSAFGKKSGKKNMIKCRRCGKSSYHIRNKVCASCGFGATATLRKYTWQKKEKR